MQFVLFVSGAICTILLILNNLFRTVTRRQTITFWELLLAFFVLILPLSALLVDNQETARFDNLEQAVLLIVIPLAIFSVGLTIVEAFQKGLRHSRGVLGIGIALLLLVSTFAYSFLSLNNQLGASNVAVRPTPVNSEDTRDPCTVAGENLIFGIFDIAEGATGLTSVELINLFFDAPDESISSLVEANDEDPDVLVGTLVEYVEESVQTLLAQDCLEQSVAAIAISQSQFFTRFLVTNDFTTVQNLLISNAPEDVDVEQVNVDVQRATLVAAVENLEVEELPTATVTPTATLTATPTLTRTPRPAPSATATRERFFTATPTLTPTLPNPCIATANFNVNMRDFPDLEESNVVLTIPFEAIFSVYAPNDDETWWFSQYDGEAGWVSDEFISLTQPCFDLPPRRP